MIDPYTTGNDKENITIDRDNGWGESYNEQAPLSINDIGGGRHVSIYEDKPKVRVFSFGIILFIISMTFIVASGLV